MFLEASSQFGICGNVFHLLIGNSYFTHIEVELEAFCMSEFLMRSTCSLGVFQFGDKSLKPHSKAKGCCQLLVPNT
jgi:hypothetical protein